MNATQLCNQDSGNPEWYTPAYIIDAARSTMGSIDLDPSSCEVANQIVKARQYFTVEDDGLKHQWAGNVWMNHPYGLIPNREWTRKIIAEYNAGHIKQACFICNASTSEGWFQPLYNYPMCFIAGRMKFIPGSGQHESTAGKGSAVIYLGPHLERFAQHFGGLGSIMVPYLLTGTQCPICERRFTPKRRDALYCGQACNQKAKRQRQKQ